MQELQLLLEEKLMIRYSFSFRWCGVCRVQVYELYILTQIFNIRTSCFWVYFIF